MQRILYKICMWMAIVISQLNAQECIYAENIAETIAETIAEESQLQELTFLVSPQDLYFDQENISVNVNGVLFSAHSLEKRGNHWLARIIARANYCPRNHLTCKECGQCHTEGCWYFVKHCKLWQ